MRKPSVPAAPTPPNPAQSASGAGGSLFVGFQSRLEGLRGVNTTPGGLEQRASGQKRSLIGG